MESVLVKLNVINRDGKKNSFDIKEGTTIRDAIVEKLSPDNYGYCEGNAVCGTCHVYVAPDDFNKLKMAGENEIMTLEQAAISPTKHSRLGCEIELKKEYDNITVTIAPD